MTQPLNYTVKAIEGLSAYPWPGMPACAASTRYLVDKLRSAEVFVLKDHGELLDRGKTRPEVPGVVFRPSFDVVALEYTANAERRVDPYYTATRSSRRIALAWDWRDDLPDGFGSMPALPAGVMIASIAWIDEANLWMPMSGAIHIAYDDQWGSVDGAPSPFHEAMIANGSTRRTTSDRSYPITVVPLLMEACLAAKRQLGSVEAVLDTIHADTADEVNSYMDLCYALACKNVSAARHPAPAALNKQRIKAGKLPLKDFHVLELAGGEMPGAGGGSAADRAAARSHLRRGHIRRLGGDRVTWVNSTIVRGRGFIDKVYAA